MMKRAVVLALSALALVACGPGAKIDGKTGAAEALLAASRPTKAQADKSATPVDLTGALTWNCPEGGTAKISGASVSLGGQTGVSTGLTLTYNGCGLAKADVGTAVFNGDLTFAQNVQTGNASVSLDQTLKGKVLVQGAFDDFLDVDVTQAIAVDALATTGASVSMTLKGTVKTSEGTHTFDEMLSVVSGTISARVSSKN